jgi:hypothetical protein
MRPAWRGIVWNGTVWAWPTLLMDHEEAFRQMPGMRAYTCRWRQWSPGGTIDFDAGCTPEDRALVAAWVAEA